MWTVVDEIKLIPLEAVGFEALWRRGKLGLVVEPETEGASLLSKAAPSF
jgi:hypothetical protein